MCPLDRIAGYANYVILNYSIVLCFFVVEVKMKVLLIFILFSVATTGVLSDVKIDAGQFVRDYLYIPYKGVPGALNPTRPHAKQLFVLALIPPGRVSLDITILQFHEVSKLTAIPWKRFAQVKSVSYPLYHAASGLMSMYVSFVDYSKYTKKSGVPVEAHPDFSILSYHQNILKEFRKLFQGKDPAMVLMYSYYSPCNGCTDELIRVKNDLRVPKATPIFLGYSKKFENKKMHQTPDANILKLTRNGFIVFNTPPAKLFSLEYLRQILQ